MTRLVVFKNGEHLIGFSCSGHSGYANAGEDIVCAAISTAVQLVISYFCKYHNDDVDVTVNEQDALMELRCKKSFESADRQISVLSDFALQLSEEYSDYFTFDYLEV